MLRIDPRQFGIDFFEESPIRDSNQAMLGWSVNAISNNKAVGGGFSSSRETARRVAVAEVIERLSFRNIAISQYADNFLTGDFPTTCGFAAGFESEKTRLRSISEGVERWAWSKWIDERYLINSFSGASEISALGQFLIGQFDKVNFFFLEIDTSFIPNYFNKVYLGITVSIKDNGVFPGSRVSPNRDDIWEHSLVESWRHLVIFRNLQKKEESVRPFDRINFFGKNGDVALKQIQNANRAVWPKPRLLISKEYELAVPGASVWRSLAKEYIGWHLGGESRFVY